MLKTMKVFPERMIIAFRRLKHRMTTMLLLVVSWTPGTTGHADRLYDNTDPTSLFSSYKITVGSAIFHNNVYFS